MPTPRRTVVIRMIWRFLAKTGALMTTGRRSLQHVLSLRGLSRSVMVRYVSKAKPLNCGMHVLLFAVQFGQHDFSATPAPCCRSQPPFSSPLPSPPNPPLPLVPRPTLPLLPSPSPPIHLPLRSRHQSLFPSPSPPTSLPPLLLLHMTASLTRPQHLHQYQ